MMAYITLRQNVGNIRYNDSQCKCKVFFDKTGPTLKDWLFSKNVYLDMLKLFIGH